jgi:hypothetical protein
MLLKLSFSKTRHSAAKASPLHCGRRSWWSISQRSQSTSATLTWIFQSLDPATNKPPTDPTAGFLPPGGEGSVSFNVNLKQGLATNTMREQFGEAYQAYSKRVAALVPFVF